MTELKLELFKLTKSYRMRTIKILTTFAACLFIAAPLPAQDSTKAFYFPYKTGDMWEYFFDGGGPDVDTVQTFTTSDSTDEYGYIHITQYQRNINPTTWSHTFHYKIDTVNNYVYGSSGLGTDNDLLYKLNAQRGDQWIVYKYDIGGYEMARVEMVEEDNILGINTMIKVFHYYAAADTTDTLGLSRGGNTLAGGFGLSFGGSSEGGGNLYLTGAVINNVLYGDTIKIITSIFDDDPNIPEQIHLYQNYPNPFNPFTTISFEISHLSDISLTVYDILGKEIYRLIDNKEYNAGEHHVVWNGLRKDGSSATSGIYFYRLIKDKQSLSRSMILLK